jgi:hypothetical protein
LEFVSLGENVDGDRIGTSFRDVIDSEFDCRRRALRVLVLGTLVVGLVGVLPASAIAASYSIVDLGTLLGDNASEATGVTDSGQIMGSSSAYSGGEGHGKQRSPRPLQAARSTSRTPRHRQGLSRPERDSASGDGQCVDFARRLCRLALAGGSLSHARRDPWPSWLDSGPAPQSSSLATPLGVLDIMQ